MAESTAVPSPQAKAMAATLISRLRARTSGTAQHSTALYFFYK